MESEKLNGTKLKTIASIVFAGMFFALIRAYFGTYIFNDKYPTNTFLVDRTDRFNDLFNMIKICEGNSPYITTFRFASNYFPVANIVFYLFSLLGNKIVLAFFFLGIFAVFYYKMLHRYLAINFTSHFLEISIIFLFSYPIFFNVDRMNIEMYNFLFCLLWLYFRDKNMPWLAILFLSLSISFKLYTGVFIVFYLKEKKYKEILAICGIVAVTSLLALLTFKGGPIANVKAMLADLKAFTLFYSGGGGLHYSLSLFGLMKTIYLAFAKILHISSSTFDFNSTLPFYTLLSLASFGGVAYVIFKRQLSLWMSLFLLVSLILLLPNVSSDYKLIFVYLPLMPYLKDNTVNPLSKIYTIGFACLLIPHNYFHISLDISCAVLIFPVILLLMVFLIIYNSKLNATDKHSHTIV